MHVKYFKAKSKKWLKSTLLYKIGGKKLVAGRKSKYSSNENIENKKIWSVALYIRLSQEDEDNRERQAGKQ